MLKLISERLDLIALSSAQLQLYREQPAQLDQDLGMPISRAIMTEPLQRAIRMKLAKLAHAEPAHQAWLTYWLMVIRAVPFGAGMAGFKGFPDENGEAEIGYGIDPAYQRQGFMTEGVQRLITWAFQEPACRSVLACDVKKWNVASQRVLAKLGMQVYRESEDALYYRLDRPKGLDG